MSGIKYDFDDFFRKIHDRTNPQDLISRNIILFGAGGIGSWTALFIGLQLDNWNELVIIDDDVLEPHNGNRFPYPFWVLLKRKMNKAEFMREFLSAIRPDLRVRAIPKRVDIGELGIILDITDTYKPVIIDATDNPNFTAKVKRMKRYDRILAHYDGRSITIEWLPRGYTYESWIIDPTAGYRTIPSLSIPPAMTGLIIASILLKQPEEPMKTRVENIVDYLVGGEE